MSAMLRPRQRRLPDIGEARRCSSRASLATDRALSVVRVRQARPLLGLVRHARFMVAAVQGCGSASRSSSTRRRGTLTAGSAGGDW